jgi:hypothetical protein
MTTRQLDSLLFAREGDPRLFTGELGLLGTWEVAHYLGVEKSRIARWLSEIEEGKTPIDRPAARLKSGPFWRIEQVEAKLASMYEEAGHPYGETPEGMEKWAKERREARARKEARAQTDSAAAA